MKINILLIEDNPADAALIKQVLNEVNSGQFEIECTDRLSLGIERLLKGGIDIVLLDLSLPDSFGLNTLTTLHSKVPLVPIIVLTHHDDEIIAIDAAQEGALDYIVKAHADRKRLTSSIHTALKRQKSIK